MVDGAKQVSSTLKPGSMVTLISGLIALALTGYVVFSGIQIVQGAGDGKSPTSAPSKPAATQAEQDKSERERAAREKTQRNKKDPKKP